MTDSKSLVSVCIPARFGSSRFPGKPLARMAGKPLIRHVYEAVQKAEGVGQILVLTDHPDIVRAVQAFGGEVRLVTDSCRTGTDRVAKVAEDLRHEIVVNVQADEIPLHSGLLSDLIDPFLHAPAGLGTLKRPLRLAEDVQNPSIVKVVTNQRGEALYFSRSPLPCWRDGYQESHGPMAYMHLGIYIFQKSVLLEFANLPPGRLEEAEKLEQLRALEYGIPIQVWETEYPSLRIDHPADLPAAEREFLSFQASHGCEKQSGRKEVEIP